MRSFWQTRTVAMIRMRTAWTNASGGLHSGRSQIQQSWVERSQILERIVIDLVTANLGHGGGYEESCLWHHSLHVL